MLTIALRGSAGVSFDTKAMTASASLLLGLDYQTKAAQGNMIELGISPVIDIKKGSLDGLSPTVSILGGPKIPIMTGNAADTLMVLAKSTLTRFMQSTSENGPGKGEGFGAVLLDLLVQPEFLGSLVPAR